MILYLKINIFSVGIGKINLSELRVSVVSHDAEIEDI